MNKQTPRILFMIVSTLYFTIGATQSSTVAAHQFTMPEEVNQGTSTMLPIADFVPNKGEGNPPFQVQFLNQSQGDYTSSQWDFGDGQTSTETHPTHTYAITGTYTVKLTVNGPDSSSTMTRTDLLKVHTFPSIHPDGWDLTFGGYGFAETYCRQNGPMYSPTVFQRQSDGKIVVLTGCGSLTRFLADGSLDPTFGAAGRVAITDVEEPTLLVQADDKIILIQNLKISRFQQNGTLDETFGVNGVADAFPNADQQSRYTQGVLQADGKLVAVGRKDQQPIIARYTVTGALDPTFNGNGYVVENIATVAKQDDFANRWYRVLLHANGKLLVNRKNIVITDPFTGATRESFILKRYNDNGTPDLALGVSGAIEFDNYFDARLTLADGTVIGTMNGDEIVRLTYQGALDATFPMLLGRHVVSDPAGRLYVSNSGYIRRYTADGQLDLDFGKQGEVQPPVSVMSPRLLVEPTGHLLALQLRQSGSDSNNHTVVLLRYLDDHPLQPPTNKPLTLLYAVLDNNLGDGWTRLVNNIEAGVRSGMTVRLLIDGPTDNDVYLYDVQPDTNPFCPSPANPTCNGRYAEGMNFWRVANENSAHPSSLYQFLVDAMNAYPTADKINLALIGHGSGWSANVLPGQPSIWRDQNDTAGGMLWDDHPAAGQQGSRSLSTKALGQALTWAGEQTGKTIDLLYLDGCSMGMAEVAYEVRNGARYLLASPNTDWATFAYDQLLPLVRYDRDGRALGEAWLAAEAALLRSRTGYPFTLALTDLRQIGPLATTVTAFADALQGVIPTQRAALTLAYQQSDRFDSNYDAKLDSNDNYLDLRDFAAQVQSSGITDTVVISHAQAVQSVLSSVVITVAQQNGSPWLAEEQTWSWRNLGGLSIYAPLHEDDAKRRIYYTKENLAWAADSTWDEFLALFWVNEANTATATAEMPVCYATTQGCEGLANPLPVQPPQVVFLPVIWR